MPDIQWRTKVHKSDLQIIQELTAQTGVFSEDEVTVAVELANEKLLQGEQSSYQFLFAEINNEVIAYTCYGEIPFTDKRFDLYWIAVHPKMQKLGIGKIIHEKTEELIKQLYGQYIYAETS